MSSICDTTYICDYFRLCLLNRKDHRKFGNTTRPNRRAIIGGRGFNQTSIHKQTHLKRITLLHCMKVGVGFIIGPN